VIPILGAGPAGSAAALVAARGGGRAVLLEPSEIPRHKVCGEFLSPEILPLLEELGLAGGFAAQRPARVGHAELHFGRRFRRFALPEPGFGLSRYAFDGFLLRSALAQGAELRRERAGEPRGPAVCAFGRWRPAGGGRGGRVLGFKAHFRGPANDAVELHFFSGGYCGLSPIEDGGTNVCGLAEEKRLGEGRLDLDSFLRAVPSLAFAMAGLERVTRWLWSGPLQYGTRAAASESWLPAGDAAGFLDPFTGTGLVAAVRTGAWAGEAMLEAEEGRDWLLCCERHRRRRRSFLRRPMAAASILRSVLLMGAAEPVAGLIPGAWLFRLTRPG